MSTRHVYVDIISVVEALTPATTVSEGEPSYVYVERQADDLTLDRTFALFKVGQEHANPEIGTGTARWRTEFELEMVHIVGKEREDGILRASEDCDQLLKELGEVGHYNHTYVEAIDRAAMKATTRESPGGVFKTIFSFAVYHHE